MPNPVRLSYPDRALFAAAMAVAPPWLRSRRNAYRRLGDPLRPHEAGAYQGFFSDAVLSAVRVARVDRFQRWPFENQLGRFGLSGLLASQSIAGIALIDTVVIVQPAAESRRLAPLSLLFHELVHIEQYRLLGTRGFLREYIRGWLAAGRSYIDVPLEEQAYQLTERYDAEPSRVFSVAESVAEDFRY